MGEMLNMEVGGGASRERGLKDGMSSGGFVSLSDFMCEWAVST